MVSHFLGLGIAFAVFIAFLLGLSSLAPIGALVCCVLYLLVSSPYIIRGIAKSQHIKPVLAGNPLVRSYYVITVVSALYLAGVYGLPLTVAVAGAALTMNSFPSIKRVCAYNPSLFWTIELALLSLVCGVAYKYGGVKIDPLTTGSVLMWATILVPLSLLVARTFAVVSVITELESICGEADAALRQHLVNNAIQPTEDNVRAFIAEAPDFFDKVLKASDTKYNVSLEMLKAFGQGNALARLNAKLALLFLLPMSGPAFLMMAPVYVATVYTAARYQFKPTVFNFVRGTQVVKG